MNVKDLLLALNMMAEKKETQYVLQYNYSYNNLKRRLYSKCLILKYYKTKLIHKIKIIGGDAGVLQTITEEMKLYA